MADTSDILGMMLENERRPAAGSGSWDAPPEARSGGLGAYLRALPERAMDKLRDRQIVDLGHAGLKEQLRSMGGIGRLVDAYDDAKESRYLPAAGNAILGVLDTAAPARAKSVAAADAALQAWAAAVKARPAQLTERAAEELEKLLPSSGRFNAYSKAHKERIANSNRAAERALPEPATPGDIGAAEAGRRLGIADRAWPGNVMAGTIAAGGASGIPGIVLDDIKGATIDPLNAMRKDMVEERRAEKEQRAMPVMAGAEPEVRHYWEPVDRLRHERNVHAGFAGGMGAAGGPTMYAAGKSAPWAARTMSGPMLGLAAELGMIHPGLAIPAAAVALAPFAVPAGLTWGGWELAKGTAGQADQAMKKHTEAGERARLVAKIVDAYRDLPGAPSLTPDQAY